MGRLMYVQTWSTFIFIVSFLCLYQAVIGNEINSTTEQSNFFFWIKSRSTSFQQCYFHLSIVQSNLTLTIIIVRHLIPLLFCFYLCSYSMLFVVQVDRSFLFWLESITHVEISFLLNLPQKNSLLYAEKPRNNPFFDMSKSVLPTLPKTDMVIPKC